MHILIKHVQQFLCITWCLTVLPNKVIRAHTIVVINFINTITIDTRSASTINDTLIPCCSGETGGREKNCSIKYQIQTENLNENNTERKREKERENIIHIPVTVIEILSVRDGR